MDGGRKNLVNVCFRKVLPNACVVDGRWFGKMYGTPMRAVDTMFWKVFFSWRARVKVLRSYLTHCSLKQDESRGKEQSGLKYHYVNNEAHHEVCMKVKLPPVVSQIHLFPKIDTSVHTI